MPVRKLRQVMLVARDIDKQARFFEKVLGLELQFRDGDRWVQFRAGDVSLALASAEESQGVPAGAFAPVLEVDDLEAALAALASAGAETGAIRDMGSGGRTASALEPGGARVVLFARSAR